MYLQSKFSFFKAGQGAFYGGRIWDRNNKKYTTIVYDCGTSPFISGHTKSLNHEIDDFKSHMPDHRCENPTEVIDILFISHLDYDHVSGLKRLLNEFDVKRIVLPYITPENRLLFLASFDEGNDLEEDLVHDGDTSGIPPMSFTDFRSFIENPIQFIRNSESNPRIIFVKPGDKNIDYQGPLEGSVDGIYERGTASSDAMDFKNEENIGLFESNFQLFLNAQWEFTTFVQGIPQTKMDELYSEISSFLVRYNFGDFKEALSFAPVRKEIRKIYVKHLSDINAHGLVLLHGPILFKHLHGGYTFGTSVYCRGCCDGFDYHSERDSKLYTLLLGDTSLNADNNPLYFPTQFLEKLKYVHVVQIPHHGSRKNWDLQAFKGLNLGESNKFHRELKVIAVCNYGVGNRYHHPAADLINEIEIPLILNNQHTRFSVCYKYINFN